MNTIRQFFHYICDIQYLDIGFQFKPDTSQNQ